MRAIFIAIFLIFMLVAPGFAELPSDNLVRDTTNSYRDKISLSNLLPESAKNIDKINEELIKTPRWYMPDLGYYTSNNMEVTQTSEEVQTAAINAFVNTTLEIFNVSENYNNSMDMIIINESSVIPYY